MADPAQIGLEILDYCVVLGGEIAGGVFLFPVVPDEQCPSAGAENALKFRSGLGAIEPMERLAGDDEIDRVFRERGRLGSGIDAVKIREFTQPYFRGQT